MKSIYFLAIFLILVTAAQFSTQAQTLSKDIKGRWEIKKFQKDKKPELQGGTLEFLADGTLITEGIFFGTQKNTFKTDKNDSRLVISNSDGTTEWLATIKNNVLRLKSTGTALAPERIYITLMRSPVPVQP